MKAFPMISKQSICLSLLGFCLVSSIAASAETTTGTTQTRPPNFVFFLVDDMGYTDIGCYGSTFYETPNIDKLAAQGVKFTNAYAACPVCSPSRAAIMSGKYPARLGLTDYLGSAQPNDTGKKSKRKLNHKLLPAPFKEKLELSEVTIAEALKQHGYRTFMTGKWHLGSKIESPEKQGFDETAHTDGKGHPGSYYKPYQSTKERPKAQGEYLTDQLATATVSFIERNKDKPFYAYVSFYSVHLPLQARLDLLEKYEAKRKRLGLKDEFTSEGKTTVRLNQALPVYAGMVEAVDQAVGSVLDTLKRLNLDDNTIVIFTSDNGGLSTKQGWPTSNSPLRAGKGWMYEGGIREPLIVKWPGVAKPGTENDSIITGTDYYPTMLDMAGLPQMPQQHKDGVSFAAAIKEGASTGTDRPVYWHYPHYGDQGGTPASAVRLGDWKLIRWYEGNRTELFNLKKDEGEKENLATKRPKKLKKLNQLLDNWLKSMDAKFPTPNNRSRKMAKKDA